MAEVASTFRRGLAVAAARPPSAIVLDEQIPGFDCTQLATVIKAAQATAPLPVLVLAQDDRIASTLRAAQLHEVASVRSGWPPEVPIFEALCQHGLV